MRAIDRLTRDAFINGYNFTNGNTKVVITENTEAQEGHVFENRWVSLHGRIIAELQKSRLGNDMVEYDLKVDFHGYKTNVTLSRINAVIPEHLHFNIVRGDLKLTDDRQKEVFDFCDDGLTDLALWQEWEQA
jgi:hypothetical protein